VRCHSSRVFIGDFLPSPTHVSSIDKHGVGVITLLLDFLRNHKINYFLKKWLFNSF
jgi:hypothetical protein